jgi:hypothetical protein
MHQIQDLSILWERMGGEGYTLCGQSVEVMQWNLGYSTVCVVMKEVWKNHRYYLRVSTLRWLTMVLARE